MADVPEMKTLGQVARIGNLTADPELRFSPSGTAVCNVNLAVNTPKEAGNWHGEMDTTFYGLVSFGSVAENVAQSLQKGDRVVVTGEGRIRYWETDDGDIRSKKEILVQGIGPDLRFAQAQVIRMARRSPTSQPSQVNEEEPF